MLTVVAAVAAVPPADVGPVMILLRDFATRAIVATTTTTAGESYRYRLDLVPPGHYEIVATTDRDWTARSATSASRAAPIPSARHPAP